MMKKIKEILKNLIADIVTWYNIKTIKMDKDFAILYDGSAPEKVTVLLLTKFASTMVEYYDFKLNGYDISFEFNILKSPFHINELNSKRFERYTNAVIRVIYAQALKEYKIDDNRTTNSDELNKK